MVKNKRNQNEKQSQIPKKMHQLFISGRIRDPLLFHKLSPIATEPDQQMKSQLLLLNQLNISKFIL
jgi:hypothetical protein